MDTGVTPWRQMPLVVKLLLAAIAVAFIPFIPFFGMTRAQEQHYFELFGVMPSRFAAEGFASDAALTLVSHVFLHGGILHLGMCALMFLQGAPLVAKRLGALRFLFLFFFSAAGGALAYILINPSSPIPAIGASGAICGVFAGYFLAWAPDPRDAFKISEVRQAAVTFLVINVLMVSALTAFGGLQISWEGHLGGFIAGALAYLALAPKHQADTSGTEA